MYRTPLNFYLALNYWWNLSSLILCLAQAEQLACKNEELKKKTKQNKTKKTKKKGGLPFDIQFCYKVHCYCNYSLSLTLFLFIFESLLLRIAATRVRRINVLCTLCYTDAKSDCNQKCPATGFVNRCTNVAFNGCKKTAFITAKTGFQIKLQPFFKDFSRTTLDFQRPPTRTIISQIVQKCTFPVYSKTLRLELFASPTFLHFLVHLS